MYGFNVAIIAGLLARLAALIFPKRGVPGALLVILGLVTYTLFVGASASVVRAALMGSLTILAVQFNRQSLALNSLGASVLFMLALNPLTLWDLGFQLSALATLGIILFADPLIAGFRKVMGRFSQNGWGQHVFHFLGDNLIVTLASQITTTIIIAYTFHRLSLIGLLTNLLVLPVQPQVMIWGGLATLGGMLFLPLGQLLGWVAWIFLQWTILAVRVTGNLPFASIELGRFDGFVLAAYYLTIVVIWRWQDLKPFLAPDRLFGQVNVSRAGLVLLGGIALTLGSALPTLPDGRTHIEFLATEAGEATLVRTANGARILIDASDAPSRVLSALAERFPPWDRHLDVLVLTGNDEAHVNGASAVVERYAVDAIIEPDAPARRTPAYQQWNHLLDQKKLVSRRARAGLSFELDGVELEILYPVDSGDNVSLRVTVGNQNILFASALDKKDMPGFGLEAVDPAQVLVASPTLDPIVRARVNPSHVILFIGRRARDVPGDAFLAQLADATILRTDESGTIEMIISGEKVEVNTQR